MKRLAIIAVGALLLGGCGASAAPSARHHDTPNAAELLSLDQNLNSAFQGQSELGSFLGPCADRDLRALRRAIESGHFAQAAYWAANARGDVSAGADAVAFDNYPPGGERAVNRAERAVLALIGKLPHESAKPHRACS